MVDVERYIAPAIGSDDLYLANASAGLMSAPVLDAVIGHLRREAEVGAGQAAIEARERLEAGYAAAARLIGADPGEWRCWTAAIAGCSNSSSQYR